MVMIMSEYFAPPKRNTAGLSGFVITFWRVVSYFSRRRPAQEGRTVVKPTSEHCLRCAAANASLM